VPGRVSVPCNIGIGIEIKLKVNQTLQSCMHLLLGIYLV